MQITDPVDPDILFQDYSFKTGTIPGLVRHFDGFADWLKATFAPASRGRVRRQRRHARRRALEERGIRAVGVDLAANITEMGRQEGRDLVTGMFAPDLVPGAAREGRRRRASSRGSNVFPHNAHPARSCRRPTSCSRPTGVLVLEVMYAGDLLEQLQWDTLYHEHLTFYSLGTLRGLLARHGFEPVEAIRIPMHGGSLRVAAARTGARAGRRLGGRGRRLRGGDAASTSVATWHGFADDSRRRIAVFGDTMRRLGESRLDLGLRRRRQGDDVGQRVRHGLPRRRRRRLAAARRQADARHAHADRQPGRVQGARPARRTTCSSRPGTTSTRSAATSRSSTGYWIVPLPEMRVY